MKCDELESFTAETFGDGKCEVYDAVEVDEAIAEFKQKLHDAEMQADLAECAVTEYKIDYDKLTTENRRLKRALWLAKADYCHHFRVDLYIRRHPNTTQTEKSMENKMIIAEMNCRAKAKQLEENEAQRTSTDSRRSS